MRIEDLLEKLEIENVEDIKYLESFCELMELDEEIPEEVFYMLFKHMDIETLKELAEDYIEEIMTGIPDDCIDFYTFFSKYKRNLAGMMNYCTEENKMNGAVGELFRFREWYLSPERVDCTDLETGLDFSSSICEALILGRVERLSMGSYSFDFDAAMDYEYDDYEEYIDRDYDEDEYDEYESDDSDITLIDKDNPVIDGEDYENYEGDEFYQ